MLETFSPPQPNQEKPKRHNLPETLMRLVSEGPVDEFLKKRAEWIVEELDIQKILGSKIKYTDKLAGKVEEGVTVVCAGAGKGHEIDELDQVLPGSKIIGLDPNDYMTRPVAKRLKTLANDASYLDETYRAEKMQGIKDKSVDGLLFSFVLHHIDELKHDKIWEEVKRVAKPGAHIFIAEDLVEQGNESELKTVTRQDQKINLQITDSPHNYKDLTQWEEYFKEKGFEIVKTHDVKPDKVRHGFIVLKIPETNS